MRGAVLTTLFHLREGKEVSDGWLLENDGDDVIGRKLGGNYTEKVLTL